MSSTSNSLQFLLHRVHHLNFANCRLFLLEYPYTSCERFTLSHYVTCIEEKIYEDLQLEHSNLQSLFLSDRLQEVMNVFEMFSFNRNTFQEKMYTSCSIVIPDIKS